MMRTLAVLLALLLAPPAFAGSLPLFDTYGDANGCKRANNPGEFVEGGVTLNANRLVGFEWSCAFAEVWVFPGGDLYGVQGLCSGEGIPSLEQYMIAVDADDDTAVTVHDREGKLLWSLKACQK